MCVFVIYVLFVLMVHHHRMADQKKKKSIRWRFALTETAPAPQTPDSDEEPEPDPEVLRLLEVLMVRMQVMVTEMESMRAHSAHHTAELIQALTELSAENRALRVKYQALAEDMQDCSDALEELLDTQALLEAKKKQFRKLSRHL